ncbi:hypothetical protein [Streptomyces sp. NPDC008240]|uniref:hypothetical protein n=1 Tax=Streptomyces sp. NPDC008240 TaxID=3364822 RepID=UPI0036E98132
MPSYQLRDTATRRLPAHGLADYASAEAALDRLDDALEHDLAANGEGAGHIRLRLDIERVTNGTIETVGTTYSSSASTTAPTRCPRYSR